MPRTALIHTILGSQRVGWELGLPALKTTPGGPPSEGTWQEETQSPLPTSDLVRPSSDGLAMSGVIRHIELARYKGL